MEVDIYIYRASSLYVRESREIIVAGLELEELSEERERFIGGSHGGSGGESGGGGANP